MYLTDDPALKVFIDISAFLPLFYFYYFHCIMHALCLLVLSDYNCSCSYSSVTLKHIYCQNDVTRFLSIYYWDKKWW